MNNEKSIEELTEGLNQALAQVPEMDENMFELIKKEVKDRADRLSGTNPSNYRGLMAEEEKVKSERKLEAPKKSFLKRILGR